MNNNIILDENIEYLSMFSEQFIDTFGNFMEENQEQNLSNNPPNNSPLLNNTNQPEEYQSETNNIFPLINSFEFSILNDLAENETIKKDSGDKLSTKANYINDNKIKLELELKEGYIFQKNLNIKYRKDAYYKYFKVIFGKFLKKRINKLKNICFPEYNKNNFSSPNYKYIGNPKEKDNYNFLSFKLKDILTYEKDQIKQNRQYNNELLINYIEKNEKRAKNKYVYKKLVAFLNDTLENAFVEFYEDIKEFENINNNKKCLFFDEYFKKEKGISLLEKNGFIKALSNKNIK